MKVSKWAGLIPETREDDRRLGRALLLMLSSIGRAGVITILFMNLLMSFAWVNEAHPDTAQSVADAAHFVTVFGYSVSALDGVTLLVTAWALAPAVRALWLLVRLRREADPVGVIEG